MFMYVYTSISECSTFPDYYLLIVAFLVRKSHFHIKWSKSGGRNKEGVHPTPNLGMFCALSQIINIFCCWKILSWSKLSSRYWEGDAWICMPDYNPWLKSWNIMHILTGGNWQKWKRVFLTCLCHEIYRDETVGLKSCKNTWKITIFVKMWNLGQYRENLIFCQ